MNVINSLLHIVKTHHYYLLHALTFKTACISWGIFLIIKKLNFKKYVINANANRLNK